MNDSAPGNDGNHPDEVAAWETIVTQLGGPPPDRWVGYCAPGRAPLAWLAVTGFPDGVVVAMHEDAGMTGSPGVILVNLDDPGLPDEVRRQATDG